MVGSVLSRLGNLARSMATKSVLGTVASPEPEKEGHSSVSGGFAKLLSPGKVFFGLGLTHIT